MTAYLMSTPKAQFFDSNGSPLSGGKVYTYAAGTNTPLATYTDSTGNVQNTNPIILNARGECDLWGGNAAYKIVLKDANDNLIWTEDGVYAQNGAILTSLTASSGSSLVGFIQSGSGAVAETAQDKMRERVSVKDFGAKGDGVTDDLAAFNAATTYCQNNLKALYIPGVTPSQYYKLSGTWSITKPIRIVTDGENDTVIFVSGLSAGQYAIDIDGTAYGTYEKADIGPMTIYAGSGDCMRVKNVSNSKFGKMVFATGRYGYVYTGTRSFSNDFEKPTNQGLTSQTFRITAHTGGGQHNIWGGSMGGDTGFVITSDCTLDSVNLYGVNFEQCTTNSLYVNGNVKALNIIGGRTEGCGGIDFLIDPASGKAVKGMNIEGVNFDSSNAGGSDRIKIGGSGGTVNGFRIDGNVVSHSTNTFSANLVNLNGAGDTGEIVGNFLNGTACNVVNTQRAGVVVYSNENLSGKLSEYWGASTWGVTQGTFTFADASGASLSFATNAATYTKIGRMVYWQAIIIYPTTANGSAAELSGLPFAVLAGGSSQGRAGAMVNATDSGSDIAVLQGVTATTNIKFYQRLGLAAVTNASLSGKTLYLSGFYAV